MISPNSLGTRSVKELRDLARQEGLDGAGRLKKDEIVLLLTQHFQAREEGAAAPTLALQPTPENQDNVAAPDEEPAPLSAPVEPKLPARDGARAVEPEREELTTVTGYLDVVKDGRGYLRSRKLTPRDDDVYVSPSQIKRFGLREGDLVEGPVRSPKEGERFRSLLQVTRVNDLSPERAVERPRFEHLTPIFPDQQLVLETRPSILATRLVDLLCPVGRGQRGLIVSPPKAGKTTILKQIANGLTENYADLRLIVVLIGERPEEVTDMRRSVDGDVVGSTFDDPVERHVAVAELALQHAIRQVEHGRDVVILLDSITRLTRAYNMTQPPSGRTLSGGLDPAALYPAKRFFGAARNLEGAGSLTMIATCLVDTGSRMDDVIYEEFKGTGNMELHLDRSLAERRIFPAMDIERSSTRREELLLDNATLQKVWTMRRMVDAIRTSQPGAEPMLAVRERMRRTRDNRDFLASLNRDM